MSPGGIGPKKSLGQHFLRDDDVHDDILFRARLSKEDHVLEIGAGDGTLTRSLAELAGRVVAIETDRRLLPLLRKEFPPGGSTEILETDILKFDLADFASLAPLKVVANLPYNIATAVLEKLLVRGDLFPLQILMFQKEVALRLVASPGGGEYGSLSLATQLRAEADVLRIVPPSAFVPPPKVESALVRIVPRKEPLLKSGEEKIFSLLTRGGFRHRRKTFLNSLSRAELPLPRSAVYELLMRLGFQERVRAEEISLDSYLEMARSLASSESGNGESDG